jgi:hypothetical protein
MIKNVSKNVFVYPVLGLLDKPQIIFGRNLKSYFKGLLYVYIYIIYPVYIYNYMFILSYYVIDRDRYRDIHHFVPMISISRLGHPYQYLSWEA